MAFFPIQIVYFSVKVNKKKRKNKLKKEHVFEAE